MAKASLYSWYGSKDALVLAYLDDLDQADRKRWQDAVAGFDEPVDKILAFFDLACAMMPKRGYRGCLYTNAASEFPAVELGPVGAHRRWMHSTLVHLLGAARCPAPTHVADEIQLLYDGALVGAKLQRSVAPITLGRRLAGELVHRAVGDPAAGTTTSRQH